MSHLPQQNPGYDAALTAFFRSGEAMRSRGVSHTVLTSRLDIPAPPARLVADWENEIPLRLALEPGDVESLPLPRARMRWPDYRACVQAVSDWTQTLGLDDLLPDCDVALMACRGARYHHDGAQYGGSVFCNLFLGEDRGLDVHFPAAGRRIPLARGTVLIFDTCQPHAVIDRRSAAFDLADFPPERDCSEVFLTWELPVEDSRVARALGIDFDTDPASAMRLDKEQVWVNGGLARVCAASGRWLA